VPSGIVGFDRVYFDALEKETRSMDSIPVFP